MFNAEHLQEKWAPVLGSEGASPIGNRYKKAVTSVLLENQERFLREERGMLSEVAVNGLGAGTVTPAGSALGNANTAGLAGFDPVLISLVRRAMPNLMAYDVCGVQPMSGPTGLIFAMRSRYENQTGEEALFNEPDAGFTAGLDATTGAYTPRTGAGVGGDAEGNNPALLNDSSPGTYETPRGFSREDLEQAGDAGKLFREMSFSIEKTSVTAKSRALKAEYTLELAQDLKAIHGLDAEQELANILSSEVLAEINREVVRTVYSVAKVGAQNNVANAGIFDLDVDSNGRWSVEKFKGLLFQIERDANAIAQETRRGKGNLQWQVYLTILQVLTALVVLPSVKLMTLVTLLLVLSTVALRSTLILTLLTFPTSTTTSSDTKVHHLMTQDCSTVLTFPSRWFARSTLTPSNQKLVSRLVTAWSAILSSPPTEPTTVLPMAKHLRQTPTCTTEEYKLSTSCDSSLQVSYRPPSNGGSFFV